MLDIAFIRNNPEVVKEGIRVKRMNVDIDELLAVDEEVRKILKWGVAPPGPARACPRAF